MIKIQINMFTPPDQNLPLPHRINQNSTQFSQRENILKLKKNKIITEKDRKGVIANLQVKIPLKAIRFNRNLSFSQSKTKTLIPKEMRNFQPRNLYQREFTHHKLFPLKTSFPFLI